MQVAGYALITVAFVANALPENLVDEIAVVVTSRRRRLIDDETMQTTVATTSCVVVGTVGVVPNSPVHWPWRARLAGSTTPSEHDRESDVDALVAVAPVTGQSIGPIEY